MQVNFLARRANSAGVHQEMILRLQSTREIAQELQHPEEEESVSGEIFAMYHVPIEVFVMKNMAPVVASMDTRDLVVILLIL